MRRHRARGSIRGGGGGGGNSSSLKARFTERKCAGFYTGRLKYADNNGIIESVMKRSLQLRGTY